MLRSTGGGDGRLNAAAATATIAMEGPNAIQQLVLKQRQDLLRGGSVDDDGVVPGHSATSVGVEGGDLLVVVLGSTTHRLSATVLRTAEELRKETQDTNFDALIGQQSAGTQNSPLGTMNSRSPHNNSSAALRSKSGTNLLSRSRSGSPSSPPSHPLTFSDRIQTPGNCKLRVLLSPSEENTTFYYKNQIIVGTPIILMYARGRRVEFFATGRRSKDSLNNVAARSIMGHLSKRALASVINHVLSLLAAGQLKTSVSKAALKDAEKSQKLQESEIEKQQKAELRERRKDLKRRRGDDVSDDDKSVMEHSEGSEGSTSSSAYSSEYTSSSDDDDDDDDLDKPYAVLLDLAIFDPL